MSGIRFFGEGTARIITSHISEAWPVADAGLGAAVYVLEILTGVIGDKRRWRTMPWMVLFFGILIVPLGGGQYLFHHHPADSAGHLVHALPYCRSRHAATDSVFLR